MRPDRGRGRRETSGRGKAGGDRRHRQIEIGLMHHTLDHGGRGIDRILEPGLSSGKENEMPVRGPEVEGMQQQISTTSTGALNFGVSSDEGVRA